VVAIADLGSYSRAGTKLGLTQPAIARRSSEPRRWSATPLSSVPAQVRAGISFAKVDEIATLLAAVELQLSGS
jgi:hypothetical protein